MPIKISVKPWKVTIKFREVNTYPKWFTLTFDVNAIDSITATNLAYNYFNEMGIVCKEFQMIVENFK